MRASKKIRSQEYKAGIHKLAKALGLADLFEVSQFVIFIYKFKELFYFYSNMLLRLILVPLKTKSKLF